MEQETNKKSVLLILINVLFFGALWGILEATLGTLLHLPFFDKAGMYMASTTIMLPIAYFLMANCYKKTDSFYAVFLMGIVASLIKLSVAFVLGFIPSVYNPAIYIVVESLMMGSALAIFRPKNVLSLRTFGAVVLANTLYQFSYLMINWAMGGTNVFASKEVWQNVGEKYLFKFNCVAILYFGGVSALSYLVLQLFAKYNVRIKFDFNKIINSPIAAGVTLAVALTLSMTLALI